MNARSSPDFTMTDQLLRKLVAFVPALVPVRYLVGVGDKHAGRVGTLLGTLSLAAHGAGAGNAVVMRMDDDSSIESFPPERLRSLAKPAGARPAGAAR